MFKPITDEPDCFAMAAANFMPLREFFEPSRGTKILVSILFANANYQSLLLFRKLAQTQI